MSESDGVVEAVEGVLRMTVTAAGQVGEHLVRAREQMLRQAQARSEQEAVALAAAANRSDHRAHDAAAGGGGGGGQRQGAVMTDRVEDQDTDTAAGPGTANAHTGQEVPETETAALATASHGRRDAGEALTAYDSAERREAFAADLEARGVDVETVATRVRADVTQARPATEAITSASRGSPEARSTRRGRSTQIRRTGLDR